MMSSNLKKTVDSMVYTEILTGLTLTDQWANGNASPTDQWGDV